jgi:hypothetical protein
MNKKVKVIGKASLDLEKLQNEFVSQGRLTISEIRERKEAESPRHHCGCDSDCHCPNDN